VTSDSLLTVEKVRKYQQENKSVSRAVELFCSGETSAAKNGIGCLSSKAFSCSGVKLKVSVKVSVQKYRQYFLQKYRYWYR